MSKKRLSRQELRIMEVLWPLGAASVRQIQAGLPQPGRATHHTVQTVLTRLEAKAAVRRAKKIGSAHLYEAVVTRSATQRLLAGELLAFFGGRAGPWMSHLIEAGELTVQDLEDAGKALNKGRMP